MLGLVGFIIFRIVPAFGDFYASFDKELPWSTRVLVAVSDFAAGNIWLILGGLVLLGFVVRGLLKSPANRERIDRAMLQLPGVGGTLRKFATAQLARTLATLLGGGIPLVNGIEVSVRSMSNRFLAKELDVVRGHVQEGRSFADALRDQAMLPDVAVKMVEVGESTGALQEMLNSIGDFYDEEIETEVSRFLTFIEPVLLIIMGLIIAVVILALYMPMIELSSVVS
jgi:type IV pilus assembly protein PilC